MNQPVYTFAKWQVKEGKLDNVLQLLSEVATQSTQETGNLFYEIHQNNADANTLLLYEGYTNQAALEAHRNASYFQQIVIGQIVPQLESREVVLTSRLK